MTNCVPAGGGGGGGSFLEMASNPWVGRRFRLIEVERCGFKNWPSFHGYCFNCFAGFRELIICILDRGFVSLLQEKHLFSNFELRMDIPRSLIFSDRYFQFVA